MFPNIQAEIARAGWSQADAAKFLNISQNSLRWKLNGKRPLLLDEIYALAQKFNCSIDYLVERKDDADSTA